METTVMAGKVNETLWRMTRLRPSTVDRLRVFEQRIRNAREMGETHVNPNEQDEISIDALVQELLRRDEEHVQRSRRSKVKRKKAEHGIEG